MKNSTRLKAALIMYTAAVGFTGMLVGTHHWMLSFLWAVISYKMFKDMFDLFKIKR